ncbi:MAG: hypothetical protein J6Y90_00415 [Lachnospiraceae bacterium]|nr:hypothetical protein [Lachnospiraceae bacterium]
MNGKLTEISRSFEGRLRVTFEVDSVDELRGLDGDLTISVKRRSKGRSLSANAYFHVLVEKIAAKQKVSHTEIHNHLISEYGFMDADIKTIIMDDEIPWQKLDTIHLRPTTKTKVLDNGKLYRVYYVMRGSHTYDTREMARLIDGTVEEAKSLDIETLSPLELQRMKDAWQNRFYKATKNATSVGQPTD